MLVERMTNEPSWRDRVRIGQQFERLLFAEFPDAAQNLIKDYRSSSPTRIDRPSGRDLLDMDHATQRFLTLVAGRAINGYPLIIDEVIPPNCRRM
jgi:hypothetical protein